MADPMVEIPFILKDNIYKSVYPASSELSLNRFFLDFYIFSFCLRLFEIVSRLAQGCEAELDG